MKKFLLCILALFMVFQLSALAESTEIVQKELLPESTTTALSVNDFATESEYPYETVGYFLDDVVFLTDDTLQVTITFTGNYGSNEYFFSNCYIPVYDYETEKLLDIFYSEVELKKPFATSSRTSITRNITLGNVDTDIFKIKVIMLESLTSLRPNCPVPYLANELVIARNDVNKVVPTITITGNLASVPLRDDTTDIVLSYTPSDVKLSDAAVALGYSIQNGTLILRYNVKINDVELKPYQGLLCEFEVDISDDTSWKLLSVTPKEGKNIEVTVDPTLMAEINTYDGYVEYYQTNDDDKTTKLKVNSTGINTYVNYVYGSYSAEVVVGGNANDVAYRFVDTDNDGTFDTVFVDRETVFVVGSVNATANKIYRSTEITAMATAGAPASITLDPEDASLSWNITDIYGNPMELADIQVNDIVILKSSVSGSDVYYDIVISDETITGMISECYTEVTKVGGYSINKFIINDGNYMMLNNISVTPGDSIIAKVYNGRVVYYEAVKNYSFGMIVATNIVEDFGSTYQIQVLNQDGDIVTLNLAEKVNGVTTSYATCSSLAAAFPSGDIIVYELNSNGEISLCDVQTGYASSYANVLDSTDKMTSLTGVTYKELTGKLGSYYITDSTIIFATETAAASITKNNVALTDISVLQEDTVYNCSVVYDENKEAYAIVLYQVAFNLPDTDTEILDEVYYGVVLNTNLAQDFGDIYQLQILNQDGEIVILNLAEKVNGATASYASSAALASSFLKGDIIAFQLNVSGELARYDISSGSSYGNTLSEGLQFVAINDGFNGTGFGESVLTESTILTGTSASKISYASTGNSGIISASDLVEATVYQGNGIVNENSELVFAFLSNTEPTEDEEETPDELSAIQYGIVVNTNLAQDFGDTYQLQVLNQDGETTVLNLANKVNGNAVSYASASSLAVAFPKGDIIAYLVNANDEIVYYDIESYHASDSSNVLQVTDEIDAFTGQYAAAYEQLNSYYITDDTIIFTTETAKSGITKSNINLSSKNVLMEDTNYSGAVLYNENNEAIVIVLYQVVNQINYDSSPILITAVSSVAVDDSIRTKFTGYVDGEEVEIIAAENINSTVYTLSVGDTALFATNNDGEMVNAVCVADYTDGYFVVVDSAIEGAADDTKTYVAANNVSLNTVDYYRTVTSAAEAQIAASGVMAKGTATTLKGFGVAGKAYSVQGNCLRLMNANNYASTFDGTDVRDYTNFYDEDRIYDYYVDSTAVAYCYNAKTGKFRVSSLLEVETDVNTYDYAYGGQLENDDLIYVYNYDGNTKLILIVDVKGDN